MSFILTWIKIIIIIIIIWLENKLETTKNEKKKSASDCLYSEG